MDFTQDAIAGEGVRRKVSVVKLINGHGGTSGVGALDRCYLSPCQVYKPAVTVDRSIGGVLGFISHNCYPWPATESLSSRIRPLFARFDGLPDEDDVCGENSRRIAEVLRGCAKLSL